MANKLSYLDGHYVILLLHTSIRIQTSWLRVVSLRQLLIKLPSNCCIGRVSNKIGVSKQTLIRIERDLLASKRIIVP